MSTFSDPACLLVAWSQGAVGTLLAMSALTVGAGLYYRYRWAYALVVSFVIALACYFEPEAILHLFNITPQSCAMTYANFEKERSNTKICEQILAENKEPGEYCSCNGETASPSCQTYFSACEAYLPNYQTTGTYCSCTLANESKSTVPECNQIPANSKSAHTNTLASQCTPGEPWAYGGFCQDTGIKQEAQFIYPTSAGEGPANPHSYYTYQTDIDNPTQSPITLTWYSESDDLEWLFVNGSQIFNSPGITDYDTLYQNQITLLPGDNTLDVTVLNTNGQAYGSAGNNEPNPTGTVDEVVNGSGQVISKTGGKSWYEVSGPPTTPSPPPQGALTNCYSQSCNG